MTTSTSQTSIEDSQFSSIIKKHFLHWNFVQEETIKKTLVEMLEYTDENKEKEIRFPVVGIKDSPFAKKFNFDDFNSNITNIYKYLLPKVEEKVFILGIRYSTQYSKIKKKLTKDLETVRIQKGQKPDAVVDFKYNTDKYNNLIKSTKTPTSATYRIKTIYLELYSYIVPGWIVEFTDFHSIPYVSTYTLDRVHNESKNYRISYLNHDNLPDGIYFKDTKSRVFNRRISNLLFVVEDESVPEKPIVLTDNKGDVTTSEIIDSYSDIHKYVRRVMKRQVYNIPLKDNGSISIFISKIYTNNPKERTPIHISLEVELHDITLDETSNIDYTFLDIIFSVYRIYMDSLIMPDKLYVFMEKIYDKYNLERQRPVDLDPFNKQTLASRTTTAWLTNKLDGVSNLVVYHANHIYLLWKENDYLKYKLIGYNKTQTLDTAFYVFEAEVYVDRPLSHEDPMTYIGIYNIVEISLDLNLNVKKKGVYETFKSKIQFMKSFVGEIKKHIKKSHYYVEVKQFELIKTPKSTNTYIKAMDKFADNGRKNDGYIIVINDRLKNIKKRDAFKLKYYDDYTIDIPISSSILSEGEYTGYKLRDNYLLEIETLIMGLVAMNPKHIHDYKNYVKNAILKNDRVIVSVNVANIDERLHFRSDKFKGNSSLVLDNINKLVEIRNDDSSFGNYLDLMLKDPIDPMNSYHNLEKTNMLQTAYRYAMTKFKQPKKVSFIYEPGSGRGGNIAKLFRLGSGNYIFVEPDEERFSVLNSRLQALKPKSMSKNVDFSIFHFVMQNKVHVYCFRSFPIYPDYKLFNVEKKTDYQTLLPYILDYIKEDLSLENIVVNMIPLMNVITVVDTYVSKHKDENGVKQFKTKIVKRDQYGSYLNKTLTDLELYQSEFPIIPIFGIESEILLPNIGDTFETENEEFTLKRETDTKVHFVGKYKGASEDYVYYEHLTNFKSTLNNLEFIYNPILIQNCNEVYDRSSKQNSKLNQYSRAHKSIILDILSR